MSATQQFNFEETRRLAFNTVAVGEKIIALLSAMQPVPQTTDSILRVSLIRRIVAAKFGFTGEEIIRQNREGAVAWARALAMFFCREFTNLSDSQIEREFKRAHGVLANAIMRVEARCSCDNEDGRRCAADIKELRVQLKQLMP